MIMIDMRLKNTSIFLNTFLILETNPTFIFLFPFFPQSIWNIDNHGMNKQHRTKHYNNQIDSEHDLNPLIMHILVAKIDMLMHIILKMANPHIIIMIKTKKPQHLTNTKFQCFLILHIKRTIEYHNKLEHNKTCNK